MQILSQHLLIREDVDDGYYTVGLLPTSNCEIQRKLFEYRDAISLLRRTQVKIFNDSLGVVRDDKLISNEKLNESLNIDIIASASMNDNTDVVHEEVAESRYVRVKFNLYKKYKCM